MYKKSLRSLTLILFCALALLSASSFSQNCNTELKVEKDRNFKTADDDGAVFNMILTNNSSSINTYTISTGFLQESCSNKTFKKTSPNVILKTQIVGMNTKSLSGNTIEVRPGQSYQFKVMVDAPTSKDYGKWSCIEVKAESPKCKEAATTILSVYLSDPSEE